MESYAEQVKKMKNEKVHKKAEIKVEETSGI